MTPDTISSAHVNTADRELTRSSRLEDAERPHETEERINAPALGHQLDDTVVLAHIDDLAAKVHGEILDSRKVQVLRDKRIRSSGMVFAVRVELVDAARCALEGPYHRLFPLDFLGLGRVAGDESGRGGVVGDVVLELGGVVLGVVVFRTEDGDFGKE